LCAELDGVIVTYDTWTPGKSPAHKQLRLEGCGTDTISKKSLFLDSVEDVDVAKEQNESCESSSTLSKSCSSTTTNLKDEFYDIFPEVVHDLKMNGQLDVWGEMMKLIKYEEFHFRNIAYLIFLDVAEIISLNNTCVRRYSETMKIFWSM